MYLAGQGQHKLNKSSQKAYLGTNSGQQQMNGSAHNVISPCLVVVPVRLFRKCRDAVRDTAILGIISNAPLLDSATSCLDNARLELGIVGSIPTRNGCCIIAHIRDPSIILQYGAIFIKVPVCNLKDFISYFDSSKDIDVCEHEEHMSDSLHYTAYLLECADIGPIIRLTWIIQARDEIDR